jgi:hypothetical protein
VVTNDLKADGALLLFVTGANRGGKTTFLRALGVSQLLFQAGLFVPAEGYRAEPRRGLFTHFVQPEDEGREMGKFAEELARMDALVEAMEPGAFLLLNETFASTNEREATLVAEGLLRALAEAGLAPGPVVDGDFTEAGGYRAAQALFRAGGFSAVFAANDRMALGVYRAAYEAGRRIPEDVSVVGFDNLGFSAYLTPPLTTVEQPAHRLGVLAGRAVLALLSGGRPTNQVLPCGLLARASVKHAKGGAV